MTDEQLIFLTGVQEHVSNDPKMLEYVINYATRGMQDALDKAYQHRHDLELILMHQICKSKSPKMREITHLSIAEKIDEIQEKGILYFNWEFITQEMRKISEKSK